MSLAETMPVVTSVNNVSANRLVKLWAERYVPDFSPLSSEGKSASSQLEEFASLEGRTKTVAKLSRLLHLDCEYAEIKTNILFSYIPNVVNLSESKRIAQFSVRVYQQVLEIYQQSPLPTSTTTPAAVPVSLEEWTDVLTQSAVPSLEQLATALEPVLKELREEHLSATDRRTLGFITTQFHLSSQLLLRRLTLPEQLLLGPYFRFIEERVSIPLQQVCEAAAQHEPDSPALAIVHQLLPQSRDIAQTVYRRTAQQHPTQRSRRGGLKDSGVTNSTIRDLQMFQCYLWVCLLEEKMTAVEQGLLPLCIMVFPSIEVTWELVRQMLQILIDEIMERVEPAQRGFLLPYTQKMQQMFSGF